MGLTVPSPLVSVDWLFNHQNADNIIIFDATLHKPEMLHTKNTEKTQIKNALFFDLKGVFSVQGAQYPNTILPTADFQQHAQDLGVCNDSCIIVYDDLGVYAAPRVWWLFKTFGFSNIAVLNGGLPEWKAKGYPTESPKERKRTKGNFVAKYQPQYIVFTKDVLQSTQDSKTIIIDARAKERFYGNQAEPRPEVRSGHIPNSVSMPYSGLQSDGKMKAPKTLQKLFKKINPKQQRQIFSCGSGITACILALGAELTGYTNYTVYDGSWTEWGSNSQLPIEK